MKKEYIIFIGVMIIISFLIGFFVNANFFSKTKVESLDSNDDLIGGYNKHIIGKWYGTFSNNNPEEEKEYISIIFNREGTGSILSDNGDGTNFSFIGDSEKLIIYGDVPYSVFNYIFVSEYDRIAIAPEQGSSSYGISYFDRV